MSITHLFKLLGIYSSRSLSVSMAQISTVFLWPPPMFSVAAWQVTEVIRKCLIGK